MHSDMATEAPDPYLSDVTGRIALIDRSRQPIQPGIADGPGCSVAERVKRAQSEGARGVVVLQTSTAAPQAFSPDGDPAGLTIPVVMIDKADGDALRAALCPSLADGRCATSPRLTASMRDAPGEWGALRVVDVTAPEAPREVGVFRPGAAAVFPPRDLGVFSPQRAAVRGSVAVVPWNSGGARVVDLAQGTPREVAAFVPPDTADPTGVLPAKALVTSVAILSSPSSGSASRDYIIVSDLNSDLYVLDAPWPAPRLAPSPR